MMKKNYLIITFLFSSMMFGQTTVFNDATADGKWSTAGNWTNGIPDETFTYGQLNNNVNLDVTTSIVQLRSSTSELTGTGNITFTGNNVALLSTGTNFTYNGSAEINGSAVKTLQVNNGTTSSRQLTLGPLSVLTLTNLAKVQVQLPSLSKVVFQGAINGAANLQFAGTAEFDAGSNNTAFTGDMVFLANGDVTANTAGDGAFLRAGSKIQVNATNVSLTLNGANSCDGNINVGGGNDFALNINANQESFGTVGVGNGTLTINVAPAVTNLSFANSSAITWGTGTLDITGYESGEIRFGNSNDALTAPQLSQITADGTAAGQALGLDANGYLVLQSSLSTNDIESDAIKKIAYPTLASNKLFFNRPQQNVKIFDLNGRMIIQNQSKSQTEIAVSSLNKGLYFVVFDNKIAEKFIKQ